MSWSNYTEVEEHLDIIIMGCIVQGSGILETVVYFEVRKIFEVAKGYEFLAI